MASLTIGSVDIEELAWPGRPASAALLLVTVHGSDGSTGHGEAPAVPGRMALLQRLAGFLVGRDAFAVLARRAAWAGALAGGAGQRALTAPCGALETALLDLQARHLDIPLYRHLGGCHRQRIPLAARLDSALASGELAATAMALLARCGVRALTVESHGDGNDDARRLRSLRDAVGADVGLRLDWLGRPSLLRAQALLAQMDELFPEFVIDPDQTLAGLARLRRGCGVALAAARLAPQGADVAGAIAAEALDVWLADALECGGPLRFAAAAASCRTFNIDIALDARRASEIGAALAVHLAAVERVANRALELAPELLRGEPVIGTALPVADGHCLLPDGPGLGVTPDRARVVAVRRDALSVTTAAADADATGALPCS